MTQLTKKESMTSLELLKEINFFRKKEREENGNDSRLLKDCSHDNLLKTIREEFSEEIGVVELNESKYYSNGKEYPMFVLTLSQAKQVLLKESKYVRKAVLKYIENLEEQLKKPLSVEEMIIKQAQSVLELKKEVSEIRNDVKTVINTVTLESGKQRKIQIEIASRVYKLLPEPQPDLDNKTVKEITRRIFSNIHRDIKRKFGVASYKDIKVVEYEKALNFIEQWIEDVI